MFVATRHCCDKIIFVFVSTKDVFCRNKDVFVAMNTCFCLDKTFVATKMILVASPANERSVGVLSNVNVSKLQHRARDLNAHAHFLAHVHLPVLLSELGKRGGSCYLFCSS